ncbi:MAG: hypothetical protein ACKO37_04230 [Vampirovibrionales bacterium]
MQSIAYLSSHHGVGSQRSRRSSEGGVSRLSARFGETPVGERASHAVQEVPVQKASQVPRSAQRMGSWVERHQQGVQVLGKHMLDNWMLIKHPSAPLSFKALAASKFALNVFGILTAIHGGFLVMPAFWAYVGGVLQGVHLPLLSRLPKLPHELPSMTSFSSLKGKLPLPKFPSASLPFLTKLK